jgi:hypothetical protein
MNLDPVHNLVAPIGNASKLAFPHYASLYNSFPSLTSTFYNLPSYCPLMSEGPRDPSLKDFSINGFVLEIYFHEINIG